MKYAVLAGRVLYAQVFIINALFFHFGHFSMASQYAGMKGVPVTGVMVIITGLMILLGGLSILLGYKVKIGAALLVLFLVPTAFIMHNFWAVSDPQMAVTDQAMFIKDLALAGAAIMFYYFGSGPLSLDKK